MQEMTFKELGVSEPMLRTLDSMGFQTATPVQSISIGPLMRGADIDVQAPTGTGKTCAFGIPLIERADPQATTVQAIVLSPTRELAIQIATVLKDLTRNKPGVRVAAIFGGERIDKQFAALRRRPQIIVATPGRLLDHMARRTVRLSDVHTVILDEADRMLDMGFRPDLTRILENVPKERQTALYSATMPHAVLDIARAFQKGAQMLAIEQNSLTVDSVTQYYTEVRTGAKEGALTELLHEKEFGLTLIFVNTKRMADRLATNLQKKGFSADALHGDMRQSQRDRVMSKYRAGELKVLVATDVASRGIDVYHIDAVINYDLPLDSDSYVHRIGRTGRAEQNGVAYTFIFPREREQLKAMIRDTKAVITPTGPAIENDIADMDFVRKSRPYAPTTGYERSQPSGTHATSQTHHFGQRGRRASGRFR